MARWWIDSFTCSQTTLHWTDKTCDKVYRQPFSSPTRQWLSTSISILRLYSSILVSWGVQIPYTSFSIWHIAFSARLFSYWYLAQYMKDVFRLEVYIIKLAYRAINSLRSWSQSTWPIWVAASVLVVASAQYHALCTDHTSSPASEIHCFSIMFLTRRRSTFETTSQNWLNVKSHANGMFLKGLCLPLASLKPIVVRLFCTCVPGIF